MDNQTNQEKVLADFVALIASNDQSKQAAIQQKLEEIMKSGGMTHEAMFKVRLVKYSRVCPNPSHRNCKQSKQSKSAQRLPPLPRWLPSCIKKSC
jgi:hypothetical protein